MKWTEQDDTTLRKLWPHNSAAEVGKIMGRTRNSVIGRVDRLGITKAALLTPDERAETFAAHINLAYKMAQSRSRVVKTDIDDLRQAALIGLNQATKTFDKARGISFATHLRWCVKSEFRDMGKQTSAEFGEVTVMDAPSGEGSETMASLMVDDKTPDMATVSDVRSALASLSDREKTVAQLRVCGYEFSEIGVAIGVSKQAAAQTWEKASNRLRIKLRRYA